MPEDRVVLSRQLREVLQRADGWYAEWLDPSQEEFFVDESGEDALRSFCGAIQAFVVGAMSEGADPDMTEAKLRGRYPEASQQHWFEEALIPSDDVSNIEDVVAVKPYSVALANSPGPAYDPAVIRRFASVRYAMATLIIAVATIVGLVLGGAAAGAAGVGLGSGWLWILGALVGAALGYAVGKVIGNSVRLQAQLALCQVQIELNTRPTGESAV